MKFGMVEGPNFMLIREYLEFPAQKMRKIDKIVNCFTPQGQTPCPMLVKSVRFMWVIGLQKLLTFGAIRLVN